MSSLTAFALPIASPAEAGLISLAVLQTFPGGVEFAWGFAPNDEEDPVPPSLRFYAAFLGGRSKDDIQGIRVTELPSITIQSNGVKMPALLDTGSPMTVLNAQAAKLAGIKISASQKNNKKNSLNAFAAVADRLEQAKAASRGDVPTIMGASGDRVNLIKSTKTVEVSVGASVGSKDETTTSSVVDFGSTHLYAGDLPGLAALNGLGVQSPPAVILGMDVLRKRPFIFLRAQENEVWFH
jgi:hypothetical protein